MSSSSTQSYADFEREYNAHLSKIRSYLAQPSNNNNNNTSSTDQTTRNHATIAICEDTIKTATACIHAMRAIAEIDGDPFKLDDTKRMLERDIGPLEAEVRTRKKRGLLSGFGGGTSSAAYSSNNSTSGGSSIRTPPSHAFGSISGRLGNNRTGSNQPPSDDNTNRNTLFGNRTSAGYTPPPSTSSSSMGTGGGYGGDDTTTSDYLNSGALLQLTESERLLHETQALCASSEQIGSSTLETMGRQREQMERSAGLIERSRENTRLAQHVLKEMSYRAIKSKIFLYCVIAILILVNGMLIVHLWRRK